jgi:hypothetical protein
MDNPDGVKSLHSIFTELRDYEQFLRNLNEVTNVESAKIIKWINDNPKSTREEYDKFLQVFNKNLQPYTYGFNKSYIDEIPRVLRRIGILLAERKEMTDQILREVNNKRISTLQTRTIERLQSNDISYDPNTKIDPNFGRTMGQILTQYTKKTPLGGKSKQNYRKSRKGRKSKKSRKLN